MKTLLLGLLLSLSSEKAPSAPPPLPVPHSHRAISFRIEPPLAAQLRAGDLVDLLFVFDSPRGKYTHNTYQLKLVLGAWPTGLITLAVLPMEARGIAAGLASAQPIVLARAAGDVETSARPMAWLSQLVDHKALPHRIFEPPADMRVPPERRP